MTYRAVFLTSLIFLSLASGRPGAAAASFDETVAALLNAEKAIEKRDPDAARAAVANAADDVARQLVDWIAYRNSLGSFEEITGFMNRNPDWPSRGRLRLNAERKLVSTMPAAVILDFFALGEPLTDDGAVLYLSALMTGGDKTRAADYARRTWVEMTFDARSETAFRKLAGPTLTSADHLARLDRLLWDGHQNSARRMFPLISDDYRKLADARIRLRQRLAGVDAAIDRVPAALSDDPGLIFERVRWRRRAGNLEGSTELLLSKKTPDVGGPGRWWDERSYIARYLLRQGHITDAYKLASGSGDISGADRAESLWLSGWIALRFLDDPALARKHFEELYANVSYPISVARGAYWSGRAAEAMKDELAAGNWYKLAAALPMTYYGQLAAARLGASVGPLTPPGAVTIEPAERAAFASHELVRAIRYAARLKDRWPLRSLVDRLFEMNENMTHRTLTASLATGLGHPDLGVRLAKKAMLDGQILPVAGYPQIAFGKDDAAVEPALTYAIIRQESVFDADAISPAGARGLMQLMPATAKQVSGSLKLKYQRSKLTDDVAYNIRLWRSYLGGLIENFDGSYIMAIAGYNAGPHRVSRWIREFGDPRDPSTDPIDWVESIPFTETRNYVQRVMENLQVYRHLLDGADLTASLPDDLQRACTACQ